MILGRVDALRPVFGAAPQGRIASARRTRLANEGTVSDPLVEQSFLKDNILVSARDLDDWTPA